MNKKLIINQKANEKNVNCKMKAFFNQKQNVKKSVKKYIFNFIFQKNDFFSKLLKNGVFLPF